MKLNKKLEIFKYLAIFFVLLMPGDSFAYDYNLSAPSYDYGQSSGSYDYNLSSASYDYNVSYPSYDYNVNAPSYDYNISYPSYDYNLSSASYDYNVSYPTYEPLDIDYGDYVYDEFVYDEFIYDEYIYDDYYYDYPSYNYGSYSYGGSYNNGGFYDYGYPTYNYSYDYNYPGYTYNYVDREIVANDEDLDVRCEVSDTRVDIGDRVTYSVDINGGNSPFDYEWDGDTEGEDDNNSTLRVEYDDDGSYHVDVTVWDDDGNVARDDCPTVVVDDNYDNDDFDIQCVISDTSIEVGDRVTIEVDIDGGNSPYNIEWDGDIDDIDGFDDNDRSQRVEFDRDGTYDLEVEVTDDDGYRRTDDCTIRVSDDDNRGIYVTTNTTPTGNLSGLNSVFLNQIPYTGPREDLMKILSFTFLLMIWSAIIATVFYKRRQKALQSERINAFKEANRLG